MSCFICDKHSELSRYTGPLIAGAGGLWLTHFPIIDGAAATRGHLLIEPKRHITELGEMSPDEMSALGPLIAQTSRLLRAELGAELGAEHVYLFRINDLVAHLHFHLLPRYPGTPREHWGQKLMDWKEAPRIEHQEIQAVSQQLARHWAAPRPQERTD